MDDAERRGFRGNIDGGAERLNGRVDRLLDLARADRRQPLAGTLDLREAVREFASRHPIIAADTEAPGSGMVRTCPETFRMIAGNLIANAEQAGATRVRASVGPVDTGESGLGPGIVRSLVESHGGTIELRDSGPGARVAVVLRGPAGPGRSSSVALLRAVSNAAALSYLRRETTEAGSGTGEQR